MMRIIVLDRPRENKGEISWERLYALGDTEIYDSTPPEKVVERAKYADILMLNKCNVTKEMLTQCKQLKFVSVIATGYNTIDIKGAAELGIKVSNVPSYGTTAIAQHAFALLLEAVNRVGYHDIEVKKGRKNTDSDWCFWDYPIMELEGKTLGIVGLGRIGKAMGKMAAAFGMNVIAHDPYDNSEEHHVTLEKLFEVSDVISLHCPISSDDYHMINEKSISAMKDGVIIINNSRGALIDGKALADALKSGKVYAAGLDTVENEPITKADPLFSAPNCYITPHISWASIDCRRRLISTAIDNVEKYIAGKPQNVVNDKEEV